MATPSRPCTEGMVEVMMGHLEIGVATLSSRPNCQSQLRVKSHGKNVRDVIIAHVICGDAHTNTPTDKQTDVENMKQSSAVCFVLGQLVKQ